MRNCRPRGPKVFPGDPLFFVQPYLKNLGVLHCPDFTVSVSAADAVCNHGVSSDYGDWDLLPGGRDNPTGESNMWGYGFNVGPVWFSNYASDVGTNKDGLMQDPRTDGELSGYDGSQTIKLNILGKTIDVTPRKWVRPGVALAAVAAPASIVMVGDTIEPPLSSIQLQAMRPPVVGDTKCQQLLNTQTRRHSGGNNFMYVDGHAKWQRWTGQNTAWGDPGSFANLCAYFKDYDGSNNPGKCQTGGL